MSKTWDPNIARERNEEKVRDLNTIREGDEERVTYAANEEEVIAREEGFYGEELLDYGFSDDDNAISKFSKSLKGQTFQCRVDEKIYFSVGQVFNGVEHFKEIFQDYVI